MTLLIISQIILFGVALAMDAFAVSVTDSLVYEDINKKKSFFIAGVFGLMQGIMPLIGYFFIEFIEYIVGESSGVRAGQIFSTTITWISFGLLVFIGGKMLLEGILETRKESEQKERKHFSLKEVLIMGIATAIDAMAVGVTLHAGYSNNATVWLHAAIIIVITFVICLIGLFLGSAIAKLFKGKYEITMIIGGIILLILAAWVVTSHYVGI